MKTNADQLKIAAVVLLLVAAGWYFWGGRDYQKVGTEAYDVAKALYSTCNLKDGQRLQQIAEKIEHLEESASLTADEAQIFRSLTLLAEQGDWKQAASETRRLMQAQLVYP